MKKVTLDLRQIEKLLESDDEFPASYNEDPTLPAYENNNRFNTITFKWIENPEMQSYFYQKNADVFKYKSNDIEKKYIRKGYLNKQDVFCLKSIADNLSDNTVLWFADFLVRKDLQSSYMDKFKGCLVNHLANCMDSTNIYINKGTSTNKKYKINVI